MAFTEPEITRLLDAWGAGDPEALAQLIPVVFDEVRELARRALARESPAHTLQPTALVNEVYLRLVDRRTVRFENRAHFFGFLADLMRRILVDHARKQLRAKRGGGAARVSLDSALRMAEARPAELVALDDSLVNLAELDARQARIVALRFFVGLSLEEIADILGVSVATVSRDWKTAKIWLRHELSRVAREE